MLLNIKKRKVSLCIQSVLVFCQSSSLASEIGLQRTRIKVAVFLEFQKKYNPRILPTQPQGLGKSSEAQSL